MTDAERARYLKTTNDKGNKRYDALCKLASDKLHANIATKARLPVCTLGLI